MVQMSPADLAVVKAIPGNDKCVDCGLKHPQWASVSFGTVFCLECSGVHRSLGVHISFVRSIAMDSWTPQQLALMKNGGNDKCANYLKSKGIAPNTPIKQKYESDAAQLYKEILKARVEGRPEPTALTKKPNNAGSRSMNNSGFGNSSIQSNAKGSDDPNGMERLTGETEQQYVARQTRLREEARARMAAKFGSGGMGGVGSKPMGGIGSDSSYDPSRGGYNSSGLDFSNFSDSITSGFGNAFNSLGSMTSKATAALQDDRKMREMTSSVKSTGLSIWSGLSTAAQDVAGSLTAPDDSDGLSELQQRMRASRTGNSKYSGFGSDTVPNTALSSGSSTVKVDDPNGMEPLSGETNQQYIERQVRLRDEAKARMEAKFGKDRTMSSSGPSSTSFNSKTSAAEVKRKMVSSDDFFSSFGA